MLLQILVAFSILANCQAYRDESPNYKWSPNYFGALGKSAPVIYSSRLSTPRRIPRFHSAGGYGLPSAALGSSSYNFEGSLGSRNQGFLGSPRNDHIKRSVCVNLADTCAVRAGLMGSLMKFPCCSGSACTLVGHSFKCLPLDDGEAGDNEQSDYDDGEPDYYD